MSSSNIRSFLTVLFCGAIFQFGGAFYAQTSTTAPVSGTPKAFKTPDQEKTKVEKVKDAKNASDNPASTKPTPQAPTEGSLSRWIDFQNANIIFLYQYSENSKHIVTFSQLRYLASFTARLNFDRHKRFGLTAGVSTGRSFNSGYDNTGLGKGVLQTNLALKELYFTASPVAGVEAQVGGLFINRGQNTESMSYDNDGYVTGYRVAVKRSKQFFFDEVSLTLANLAHTDKPNLNKRWYDLKHSNYHQILVSRKFGKDLTVSTDYTFHSGSETVRQGLRYTPGQIFDSIRFESYERLKPHRDFGFSVQADRTFWKRLTLGGGFAAIDRQFGTLNADRFGPGKRVFANSAYKFTPDLKLLFFAGLPVANSYPIGVRNRFDLWLSYNLLPALKRSGIF